MCSSRIAGNEDAYYIIRNAGADAFVSKDLHGNNPIANRNISSYDLITVCHNYDIRVDFRLIRGLNLLSNISELTVCLKDVRRNSKIG